MSDIIVSIRMPKSLAEELKILAKKQHFLDLSEEIRSIVRKEWLSQNKSWVDELRKLREEIQSEIRKKSAKKIQREVAKELDRIKHDIIKEKLGEDGK